MLVDDDDDDHALIKDVCSDLGILDHLHLFHGGFELLDYLNGSSVAPFIILCDINMPKLDGLRLRAMIAEDPVLRRKSIPFIFFSTSANESQVRQAYDLTVQGFFIKGKTYDETLRKFERILLYWCDCKHPNVDKKLHH